MEITEVRIKLDLESAQRGERLRGFCSVTLDDCFVVRDLKIIEGSNGLFVAMPSRKLTFHCPHCRVKNHLLANFCNQCGRRIAGVGTDQDHYGRDELYADIAHPINGPCREMIQERVIAAYEEELARSREPGYVSSYDAEGRQTGRYPDAATPRQRPSGDWPAQRKGPDERFGAGIFDD